MEVLSGTSSKTLLVSYLGVTMWDWVGWLKDDCKSKYKLPSKQRLQCLIHNGTLENFIWSIILKTFFLYRFNNYLNGITCFEEEKIFVK